MNWNSCIPGFENRGARLREYGAKELGRSHGLGALNVRTPQVWEVLLEVNTTS